MKNFIKKILGLNNKKRHRKVTNITQEYIDQLIADRDLIVSTRSYLQHQSNLGTNSPASKEHFAYRLQNYTKSKDSEFRSLEDEIEAVNFYLSQQAVSS